MTRARRTRRRLRALDEALEAWGEARTGLIREAESIPASRYGFRPAPGTRSVAELLRHTLEVSLMAVGELKRRDTDFHRLPWPELLALHGAPLRRARTKAAILGLLQRSLSSGRRALRRAGPAEMRRRLPRFARPDRTKLAWLYYSVGHEEYHRGQLALYARLMGREPAQTRLLRLGPWGRAGKTGRMP